MIQQIAPDRLVFLDESGFSLTLFRLYGWGKAKERLVESVPFVRGKNRSVLGAFSQAGMIATMSQEGSIKRVNFEHFLKVDLLPNLAPGSVIVLDNARIHHGGEVESLVKEAGCSLLYLPAYSPDFSPIELAWGWIKNFVRGLCPRVDDARVEAVAKAIRSLPSEHAISWFRKCGYSQS